MNAYQSTIRKLLKIVTKLNEQHKHITNELANELSQKPIKTESEENNIVLIIEWKTNKVKSECEWVSDYKDDCLKIKFFAMRMR